MIVIIYGGKTGVVGGVNSYFGVGNKKVRNNKIILKINTDEKIHIDKDDLKEISFKESLKENNQSTRGRLGKKEREVFRKGLIAGFIDTVTQ